MSRFFQSYCRERCKTRKLKRSKGRSAILNLSILVIAGIVGVFYLFQTNFIAIEGYKIDDLKKQISELQAQNRDLELKTIEMQSIVNLEDRVSSLNMVEVGKVSHIDKVSSAVALR
jgi:hypothetical protein